MYLTFPKHFVFQKMSLYLSTKLDVDKIKLEEYAKDNLKNQYARCSNWITNTSYVGSSKRR